MKNENVSNIDWDMIERCKNPSNFIQHYISSLVDKDSLNLLRERMNSGETEENKMAEQICDYYKKHGIIPSVGSKIGRCISYIRKKIRQGESPYESTVKMFNKAGIWEDVSSLNIHEIRENEMAQQVCAYYKKHGHLPLFRLKLGKWIGGLRFKIKKGGSPYESTVEILKHDGILEEVICINMHEIKENEMAEKICAYHKKHGHIPLTSSNLGQGINGLRKKIRDGRSPCESTIKMFKKSGIWEEVSCLNIHEFKQNEMAQQVCIYHKKHGRIPFTNSKLGKWIGGLRSKIKKGGSPEKSTVKILKKAGIWEAVSCINTNEIRENKTAEKICVYHKKNGRIPSTSSPLGVCVSGLRYKIKQGKTPYESTIKMFKKAGIWDLVIGKD